jgi:hypothetical protein
VKRFLAVALLLWACTSGSATDAVVLDEFSIALPEIDASTRELTVENQGEFTHTLVISDGDGRVVLATDAIEPGDVATVPVQLVGGTYQFSCRIVVGTEDGGISDHFELGMVSELEVET